MTHEPLILEEDCDGCEPRDGHRAGDAARCHDCNRLIWFDDERADYRHAEDPATPCFLIGPDARTVDIIISGATVTLVEHAEHACWYEQGKADELGAYFAPMMADDSLPTFEDVSVVEVKYADA